MKKYLFIVLLVGVWSCGDKPVDFSTLIVKDGLVYKSDNSKLFDGKVYKKYSNNSLKFEGNYIEGKKNGLWFYWYNDGSKKLEGNYIDNSFDGVWKYWYEDSTRYYEGKVVDYDLDIFPISTKENNFLLWDDDDSENIIIKFHGSFGDGMKTFWDSEGNLLIEGKAEGHLLYPELGKISKTYLEAEMSLAIAKLLQFITANIPESEYFEIERKFTEFSNLNFDNLSFKNINAFIEKILQKTNDENVISFVRSKLVEIYSYSVHYNGGSLKAYKKVDDWKIYDKNGSVAELLSFNSALSNYSQSVLNKINSKFTIKAFFSENLPGQLASVKMNLKDLLDEYQSTSNKINYNFFNPQIDGNAEKDANDNDLRPVKMQVVEGEDLKISKVFLGLVFEYKGEKEIIPVVQSKEGLEYLITSKINTLVGGDKKNIGIVDLGSNDGSNMNNIKKQLKLHYEVKDIDLTKTSSINSSLDLLLISGANDSVDANVLMNLKKYIKSGNGIFIAQSGVNTNMQTQQAVKLESNILSFLQSYGFRVNQNLVLDKSCNRVQVQQQMGFTRMNVPMDYPFLPIIKNFNKTELVASGIEQIHLFFPSQIDLLDKPHNSLLSFTVAPLFTTSDSSNVMFEPFLFSPDPKVNSIFGKLDQDGKIVAAISRVDDNSEIILVSDSKFFTDDGGMSVPENMLFTMNATDYLIGKKDLLILRNEIFENSTMGLELGDSIHDFLPSFYGYIDLSNRNSEKLNNSSNTSYNDENLEDKLKKLKSLLDQGLISKDQYKEKSDKLLGL